MMHCDALVIGAGPAGSTVANLLAAAGWSVAIVEKSEFPRRKVCGEFVSAAGTELLGLLGIAAPFHSSAGPEVRRVALFARRSAIIAPMPPAALSSPPIPPAPSSMKGSAAAASGSSGAHEFSHAFGRALGRERLDTLLLAEAERRGTRVWQPYRACTLEASGDEYVCTLASGQKTRHLRAPVIVAAHGSWERGHLPTQRSLPHRPSDWLAFKARFRDADLASDLMPLLAFPGGYGGLVHSDGGRVSLSCCVRRTVLERCRRDNDGRSSRVDTRADGASIDLPARCSFDTSSDGGARRDGAAARPRGSRASSAGDAVLAHIVRMCAPARECLAGARIEEAWLGAGPIAPGIRLGAPRGFFAVGNAAGEAHPVIAEGISMAMQSGALLAALLVEEQDRIGAAKARERLEAAYSAAWRKRFASRIRTAAVLAHLAAVSGTAEALLPLVRAFPAALTLGARWSGKADAPPLPAFLGL